MAMHVAIVGAGELGGAVAHALAQRDVARRITLIDEHGRVAEGKALDIAQAAPVEGFATPLEGARDLSSAAAAEVIVVADRFSGGEWSADETLGLVKRIAHTSAHAFVLFAGAQSCAAIDRSVRELKWPRQRMVGSAPEALAAGARALVALAANASPRDVALTVLGIPPSGVVVTWANATIGGFALTELLDEPSRRRIDVNVRALWPPGPLALAAAAAKVVSAIGGRSRQLATCFVAPESASGVRARTAALPVRFGPAGLLDVVVPPLNGVEKVALENAMQM